MNYYPQTAIPPSVPTSYAPTSSSTDMLDYNAPPFIPQYANQVDPMTSFYGQSTSVPPPAPTATSRAGSLAATAPPQPQTTGKAYAECHTTSSGTVPPPGIMGLEPRSKMISKWIRGIKRDFIPLTIRRGLYEPPKPDTPPAKVWPFGYDPIWSEDLESPTMVLVSQPFCRS